MHAKMRARHAYVENGARAAGTINREGAAVVLEHGDPSFSGVPSVGRKRGLAVPRVPAEELASGSSVPDGCRHISRTAGGPKRSPAKNSPYETVAACIWGGGSSRNGSRPTTPCASALRRAPTIGLIYFDRPTMARSASSKYRGQVPGCSRIRSDSGDPFHSLEP